jgi:membrane protease YdiL (CAAX protease family)
METSVNVRKKFNPRLLAALGVIFALFWPVLFIRASHDLTDVHVVIRTIGLEWGATLVLAAIGFGALRRSASWYRIGMFGWRDALAMLVALPITFCLAGLVAWYFSIPVAQNQLQKLAAVPLLLRAGLVLTAGIAEEFMYRGFAIEELAALIGNRRLAALASFVCFTVAHIGRYGLSPRLLMVAVAGAILTILYLWSRNLPVCMLLHAVVDGIGIIVVPAVAAHLGR